MSLEALRVTRVFGVLLILTAVSLWFTSPAAHGLLSGRGAAAVAALVAFTKAWLVSGDFMELRGTVLWRVAGAWFLAVGAVCVALVLR